MTLSIHKAVNHMSRSSKKPAPKVLLSNNKASEEADHKPRVDSSTALVADTIIFENTDNETSAQPGGGLIETRKNRLVTALGDRSELVSVIVQAYNRLDKTKKCVESILKYTTDFEYELVLIDNGSTDGTFEYYKSIHHPRKKIIRVTKNIGSYVSILQHLDGRYIVFITNDTYVTKNWLNNLLICLKSNDAIGMVVPLTTNASNLQDIDISFNSLEEMQEKASQYNVSNPKLWHERLRLIFQLAVFRRETMEVAGALLDYGYYHDFVDDDVTFRIRRAGYKTILCKDTFVHHDHIRSGLSEKELEDFNRSIETGKKDFTKKYYGIDAWKDVNNYEITMMSLINPQEHDKNDKVNILGIDVACGSPILELKNKLRENDVYNTDLAAFSTDPKYWVDLNTICTQEVVIDRIEFLNEHFDGKQFDYVVLGKPINAYQNPLDLINKLAKLLKNNGHLILKLRNTFDFLSLYKTLGSNIQINNNDDLIEHVYHWNINELAEQIVKQGFIAKRISVENWPMDENFRRTVQKAIISTGLGNNLEEILKRTAVRDYVLDIVRI